MLNRRVSNPQARPLSIGRAPSLLQPSASFMGHQRNIAENVGQKKIVNTEELEAMRRALEQSAMDALSSRSSSDPIGLKNELESRRDGTGDAPPRYLNQIERRSLEYAKANIQALIEDIVEMSKTPEGLNLMEMEIAELGRKHPNLTPTEKWKMRKMMYYIKVFGNTPNRGIGGEQKQSYRRSYSPLDEAPGDFRYDGYDEYGQGYNDLGGGRRKKRKTKKRKSKKKKTKKRRKKQKTNKRKKQKTNKRKKQKTNKRKRKKYKKKSTRKR